MFFLKSGSILELQGRFKVTQLGLKWHVPRPIYEVMEQFMSLS